MAGQTVNYAQQYSEYLANAYPSVLLSGALWSADNASKYKVIDADTIQIPVLKTNGRVDGDVTKIGDFSQNFSNEWEPKKLTKHRIFQTLVHPNVKSRTGNIATIQNITKTMNETQKFPELDAMIFSEIYRLKNGIKAITPETADLTPETALAKFDKMMEAMDEALVPAMGRILYCDTFTKTLLKEAIKRQYQNGDAVISRNVTRIDEVEIQAIPTKLFKTAYTFNDGKTTGQETGGFVPAAGAKDIAMLLVHPSSILPVVSYSFAQIETASALSQGKDVYFEESFEDVFILNEREDAIQICIKKAATTLSDSPIDEVSQLDEEQIIENPKKK